MRALRLAQWLLGGLGTGLAGVAMAATLKFSLLVPADDPRLERGRLERGHPGQPTGPVADALKVALREGQVELDAAGARLELTVLEVADAGAARAAAVAAEKAGAQALLTDLDSAGTSAVAEAVKLPVLNLGQADDALRQAQCRRNLLHVALSERMKTDALAQFLAARRWPQVLLLVGSQPQDEVRAVVAAASIRRHGLKLVAQKSFKLSADPRDRDLANPLLLTGASVGSYDVVWVVDSDGEFGLSLPLRTALPRPVIGDGGTLALAWSSKLERYGAPQVTRKLSKAAGRPMGSHDWQAWMAGKVLVAAAVAAKGAPAAFAKALETGEFDGSKGVVMSFRPWDGQLRQPVVLSDGQGVAAVLPMEGVMHPRNALDTLGADAPEKLCKARS